MFKVSFARNQLFADYVQLKRFELEKLHGPIPYIVLEAMMRHRVDYELRFTTTRPRTLPDNKS